MRFVVSLNLGPEPTCAPLLSRRAACPELRFKLDATAQWDDALLESLAASGTIDAIDAIDFKGVYQGTLSATHTDPDLYRRVAEALPAAWLEDPDLTDPAARAALRAHRHRVTWDAPIHSAADIADQPWPARTINIKPSRFGTLRALLDTYDHCAAHGIDAYGGGQYELGPGRGQIQYLAALFHPDAPNDLAPAGFDHPTPPPDAPCSPMTVTPAPTGFGARPEPRREEPQGQSPPHRRRQLTLLAVPACPLSARGRHVLGTLAADGLLAWREVATGTPDGERLQGNAPDLLPALFDESGLLLAHGRLSERRLRRALATLP